MTTIQTRWTTGRTLVVIIEAIVALIGAALAGMAQGGRMGLMHDTQFLNSQSSTASSTSAALSAAPSATASAERDRPPPTTP